MKWWKHHTMFMGVHVSGLITLAKIRNPCLLLQITLGRSESITERLPTAS